MRNSFSNFVIFATIVAAVQTSAWAAPQAQELYRFKEKNEFPGHMQPFVLRNDNIYVSNEYGSGRILDPKGKVIASKLFYARSIQQREDGTLVLGSMLGEVVILSENGQTLGSYKSRQGGYYRNPLTLKNGNIVLTGNQDIVRGAGHIIFLTAQGSEISYYRIDSAFLGSPVETSDGNVAIADSTGTMYRINSSGKEAPQVVQVNSLESSSLVGSSEKAILVVGAKPITLKVFDSNAFPVSSHQFPKGLYWGGVVMDQWLKDWVWVGFDGEKLHFKGPEMEDVREPVELDYVKKTNNHVNVYKGPGRGITVNFNNTLYFFDRARRYMSSITLPRAPYGGVAFLSDGTAVTGSSNGVVYFIDTKSGRFRAFFETPGVTTYPIVVLKNDTVVVGNSEGYLQFLTLQ